MLSNPMLSNVVQSPIQSYPMSNVTWSPTMTPPWFGRTTFRPATAVTTNKRSSGSTVLSTSGLDLQKKCIIANIRTQHDNKRGCGRESMLAMLAWLPHPLWSQRGCSPLVVASSLNKGPTSTRTKCTSCYRRGTPSFPTFSCWKSCGTNSKRKKGTKTVLSSEPE